MPDTPENQNQSINHQHPGIPPLTFDPNIYRHYVEDFDLTEEQQTELLATLWQIMVAFVDLGFNIHPVQLATNSEGKTVDVMAIVGQCVASETDNDKGGLGGE